MSTDQGYDYDFEDSWPNVNGEQPDEIIPVKQGKKPYADKARDKERLRNAYSGIEQNLKVDKDGFPIGRDGQPEHRFPRIPKPPKKPNLGQRLMARLNNSWKNEDVDAND